MSRPTRPSRAARKQNRQIVIDALEPRIIFAAGVTPTIGPITEPIARATPASVLTKSMRQELFNGLNVYTKAESTPRAMPLTTAMPRRARSAASCRDTSIA
jgi:hypothetical protein